MALLPRDPFTLTADPALYQPRVSTERALEALVQRLRDGEPQLRLGGPPGFGKTLLLHLLGARLGRGWRTVYLPYPKLESEEIWHWAARGLGIPERSERGVLEAARAARRAGGGIVLLVDDAHATPQELRRELDRACEEAPGLHVVLCETDRAGDGPRAPAADEVRLDRPLDREEARAYLLGRLEAVGAAARVRARFAPEEIERLQRGSHGIPGLLHVLAAALLQREEQGVAEPSFDRSLEPPEPRSAPSRELDSEVAGHVAAAILEASARTLAVRGVGPQRLARWLPLGLAAVALLGLLATGLVLRGPRQAELRPLAQVEAAPPPVREVAPAPRPPRPREPRPVHEPRAAPGPPLAALPRRRLSVNAVPWARILLDGEPVGETPLGELPVRPGSHTLVARFPDGRIEERRIEVGETDLFVVMGRRTRPVHDAARR